jgi:hypothetical protein
MELDGKFPPLIDMALEFVEARVNVEGDNINLAAADVESFDVAAKSNEKNEDEQTTAVGEKEGKKRAGDPRRQPEETCYKLCMR